MNTSIKRWYISSLVVGLVVIFMSTVAWAEENTEEWTVEIGQQLTADGWESYAPGVDSSVVGYALHFVELERGFVESLGLGFELDTGQTSGVWGISKDDMQLNFFSETPFRFSADSNYNLENYNQIGTNDSWLLTIKGKPLHLRISNIGLPRTSEHNEEKLEIKILPKRINLEQEQIESEVSISYETEKGTTAQAHTTAWVGATSQSPIAVISRQVDVGRRTKTQFFAVYLASTLLPDELIPKDAALLPVGSIAGVQEFMKEPHEKVPSELGLGVIYKKDQWGFSVDGVLPIQGRHKVYGSIQLKPDLVYILGVEGGLNQELSFVAELGNSADNVLSIRMGLRDERNFGEKLLVVAEVLPIQFTLAGPKPDLVMHWRVYAAYDFEEWSLWYKIHNNSARLQHDLGVSLFTSKPVGVSLALSWDEVNRGRITAGIKLKF